MKKLFIVSVLLLTLGLCRQATAKQPPFDLPPKSEVLKIRSAILETSQGRIFIELFPEEAPWHVANFKYLADKGFYKDLSFFIYKPDYLIQAGDPQGTGKGAPVTTYPPNLAPDITPAERLGWLESQISMKKVA